MSDENSSQQATLRVLYVYDSCYETNLLLTLILTIVRLASSDEAERETHTRQ